MKKTLAILLALVLCLSAFVMIACNNCEHNYVDGVCTKCGEKDPDYKPNGDNPNGGGNDVEVPVAEGKITLYFTMSDSSVAIPSYASPYITGGQFDWATGTDAVEFTRLGETKTYYVQIAYDATKTQANDYQIVLGYNASSQLPADKLGLKWVDTYKSDECAAVAYPDNPTFTVAAGANTVNLGVHTFSTEVAEPIRINTTLAVTFIPALPETAEVYIIGTVNEWNTTDLTKSKATADANREVYTLALKDVLCSTHYYKILVFLDGTENVVKPLDAEGKEGDIWTWQRPATATQADEEETPVASAEKKHLAYIEISAGEENLPVSIVQSNRNSTVDLAGTNRRDELDKDGSVLYPKKGIDIMSENAKLTEVEGKQDKLGEDGKPVVDENGNNVKEGNGIWATKYIVMSNKTLTVTFADALPEAAEVYVIGSFLASDWATTVDKAHMTIAADRKSASVIYAVLPGDYEFNVIVIHKDIELNNTVQNIWDYGTALSRGEEGNNVNVKITISGFGDDVVDLFTKAQAVPEIKEPVYAENVVLKVKFDKEIPADRHVIIAGSFTAWGDGALEMTKDATDPTLYTLTVAKFIIKDYECKVGISKNTQMDWSVAWGKDAEFKANDNWSFTVAEDTTEVQLFGTAVLEVPEFKTDVTVTVKVTFAESMEGKFVAIKGSFTGGTWPTVMMTSTDNLTFTAEVTAAPGEHEFIIGVGATEEEAKAYSTKLAGTGEYGSSTVNAKVTLPDEDGEVALFTKTIPAPSAKQYAESVTFTVTFSEEITGNVFLVGDMNNWSFQKMTAGENNTYTITLTNVEATTHGYKVLVTTNETAAWGDPDLGANAPAYGGSGNASVTIETTTTSVTLFEGLTLVAPVTTPAE